MAYANLTGNVLVSEKEGIACAFPPADGAVIFDGGCVFLASGKADWQPAAGSLFAGVADGQKGGSVIVKTRGVFRFAGSGLAAGDVGKAAWLDPAGDPASVTVAEPETSGDIKVRIGTVVGVIDAYTAEVSVTGFALRETAAAVS